MTTPPIPARAASPRSAVLSMSLCVAMLIAAEFMPVSLLTPIAASLGASEGQAGQAIGISGIFAVLASLGITALAGRIDRKIVLLAMTLLMLASLVLTALAPDFTVLMVARACLGIAVGGFWSLSTAVIMRLVPAAEVPGALALMFAGQASAVAFAAPIGSYLGGVLGWRAVFWLLTPIVLANLAWQVLALPRLPARGGVSLARLGAVALRPQMRRALVAVLASFAGAFAMFTYLRPFLETVTGVAGGQLSLMLLALGCAGFLGTWGGGRLSRRHAIVLLRLLPLAMAAVTLGLLGFGHVAWLVAGLLALWGVINTALPISWMSWVTQEVGEEAEAAGGLMVATIQAAILAGASLGGLLLDHAGIGATFLGSAVLLGAAALLVGSGAALRGAAQSR